MGLKGALLFCTKIYTNGDYKMTQNLLSQDDAHAHRKSPLKSVQIAGGGATSNTVKNNKNL